MFWPWVGCVMATQMIVSMIVMVPIMTGILRRTNAFAVQHPDRVRIMSAPGQYHMQIDGPVPPDLFLRDMSWFVGGTGVAVVVAIVMLAAAVVRRLHDSGRAGWWGVLPLPFLLIGLVAMFRVFEMIRAVGELAFAPPFPQFAMLFANNVLYLGLLALLVVQLCRPGDPDANRFGPPTG